MSNGPHPPSSSDGNRGDPSEARHLRNFSNLMREKSSILISSTGATMDDKEYSEERRSILSIAEGQRKAAFIGVAGGICTFITLRRMPKWIVGRYIKKRDGMADGRRSPTINDWMQQRPAAQWTSASERAAKNLDSPQPGWGRRIFRGFSFLLDFWISSLVSSTIFSYYSERSLESKEDSDGKRMLYFFDIPLVEGRSVFSDAMCKDCVNLHDHIPSDERGRIQARIRSRSSSEKTSNDVVWSRYFNLVSACRRRILYEDILRKERGLPPGTPVAIPPPGVPPDVPQEWGDISTSSNPSEQGDILMPWAQDSVSEDYFGSGMDTKEIGNDYFDDGFEKTT